MEPINTGRPEAVWRGAHPALWIAIFGGLIAFAWEMFQLPLYSTDGLGPVEAAYRCGLASFGDAGIMVAAYLGASLGKNTLACRLANIPLPYLSRHRSRDNIRGRNIGRWGCPGWT